MHPDQGGTVDELGPGSEMILDGPHESRLARARRADQQNIARRQTSKFFGQGDRELPDSFLLANHPLTQSIGNLGRGW